MQALGLLRGSSGGDSSGTAHDRPFASQQQPPPVRPPFHAGVSIGADMLLDLAAVAPGAIRAAALVVPGRLQRGGPASIPTALLLRLALYRLLPCSWTERLMLACILDEPAEVDPLVEQIKLGIRRAGGRAEGQGRHGTELQPCCSCAKRWCAACPPASAWLGVSGLTCNAAATRPNRPSRHVRRYPPRPAAPTDDQLRLLTSPVFLTAAELDVWGPGQATMRHAREVWAPSQLQALLLQGARHVPSQQRMGHAIERITAFFEAQVSESLAADA